MRPFLAALALLLATGCGAKTGLKIPDAGPDGGMCVPGPLELERRGAEVLFVIDRSGSMELALDGRELEPPERDESRWALLVGALRSTLPAVDGEIDIGAKLFPQSIAPTEPVTHENGCVVTPGIELEPAARNADRLVSLLEDVTPRGGTPTFDSLTQARDHLVSNPTPEGVAQVIVLATDGGPNCNPDTGIDPAECVCTTERDDCGDTPAGPYNCLDDMRTLELMDAIHRAAGIPIYVVGIDNTERPELVDVLERMAVAGGRAREVAGEPSYYSVREPADLESALGTITDLIADCVFTARPAPADSAEVTVRVGGVPIRRDATHTDGWDWTARGELALFGTACTRAAAGAPVSAGAECADAE